MEGLFPGAQPSRTTGERREGVGDRIGPPPIRTLLAFCQNLRRAGPCRPKEGPALAGAPAKARGRV